MERRQGRTPDGSDTIVGHADVRRMLMTMKGLTRAVRALCYDCAFSLDMARAGITGHEARGAFLTPIAKAFGTDTGIEVAQIGIQVHGGMGFIEETGAAQFLRDVRVTAIYEGTNGIQAADLVGRKLADGGEAARGLLGEIQDTAGAADRQPELSQALRRAARALSEATDWMLAAPAINDRLAGSVPYLRAWGLALGGHYLLKGALVSEAPERLALAAFFIRQLLPRAVAECAAATEGAEPLYAIPAERLSA